MPHVREKKCVVEERTLNGAVKPIVELPGTLKNETNER